MGQCLCCDSERGSANKLGVKSMHMCSRVQQTACILSAANHAKGKHARNLIGVISLRGERFDGSFGIVLLDFHAMLLGIKRGVSQ